MSPFHSALHYEIAKHRGWFHRCHLPGTRRDQNTTSRNNLSVGFMFPTNLEMKKSMGYLPGCVVGSLMICRQEQPVRKELTCFVWSLVLPSSFSFLFFSQFYIKQWIRDLLSTHINRKDILQKKNEKFL